MSIHYIVYTIGHAVFDHRSKKEISFTFKICDSPDANPSKSLCYAFQPCTVSLGDVPVPLPVSPVYPGPIGHATHGLPRAHRAYLYSPFRPRLTYILSLRIRFNFEIPVQYK